MNVKNDWQLYVFRWDVCVCELEREGGRYMDKGDNGTCLKFSL